MTMATRSSTNKTVKKSPSLFRSLFEWLWFIIFSICCLGGVAFGVYVSHLNDIITSQFEGKRWSLPARVYARPLELYAGKKFTAAEMQTELQLLQYRVDPSLLNPGTYHRKKSTFDIYLRDFAFWDSNEPTRRIRVVIKRDNTVASITDLDTQESIALQRFDPITIDSIYPAHNEDRILVKLDDVPPVIVDTLIAVEDRNFYEHVGIYPKSIIRAMIANWKAGRTVQGASTLTQQLVKNFFLSNERSWKRKIKEAIMALLLDAEYSKNDILEAYMNEVYLGQDGRRAIHGFGLASHFYFSRPLKELDLPQIALLVGIVNGPSEFNPRKNPESAKERRNLVLSVMAGQNLISEADAKTAESMPLEVVASPPSDASPEYPAFMGLVRQQLRKFYKPQDLTSEGLSIFTTLDPHIQARTEKAVTRAIPRLERRYRRARNLQTAAIVVNSQTGEVQGIVGDKDPKRAGFNRAVNARRSIGSLIKPVVYVTALMDPAKFTLATLLDDSKKLVYRLPQGGIWKPHNDGGRLHGMVTMLSSLTHSFNIPSARLGLELTVPKVIDSLHRFGLEKKIKPFPAILLGAINLSAYQVASFYQTLASGGFRSPLRSILAVAKPTGEALEHDSAHYSLDVEQVIPPGPSYLITFAMQNVVARGTGRGMKRYISSSYHIAGKTGTTNNYVDSWFAGFSQDKLTVVWVGKDDNKPTGLTGARGAMPVWIEIMKRLDIEPLDPTMPGDVVMARIDPRTGTLAHKGCYRGITIPFIEGSVPGSYSSCGAARSRFGRNGASTRKATSRSSRKNRSSSNNRRRNSNNGSKRSQPKPKIKSQPVIIESW